MNFTSSKKLIAKGRLIMMAALLVAGVMLGTTTTLAETDNVIVNETTKMAALDAVYWDGLGSSGLAIEGTTVVAGSSVASYASYDRAGAAYVFDCSTLPCRQASKLLASDRSDNAGLGYSIAISGTTVVVGTNGLPDAVYVFDLADCTTICFESQKLTASDGGDYDAFGLSVAVAGQTVDISGSTAILGAASPPSGESWGAYVFDLATCGSACTEVSKLISSDFQADDIFGYSVAIDGTTALVGAFANDDRSEESAGSAYVFNVATCGAACTESTKLLASNPFMNKKFGIAVGVSGTTIAVSGPGDNTGKGSVYLFTGRDLSLDNRVFTDGFEY